MAAAAELASQDLSSAAAAVAAPVRRAAASGWAHWLRSAVAAAAGAFSRPPEEPLVFGGRPAVPDKSATADTATASWAAGPAAAAADYLERHSAEQTLRMG